MKLPALEISTIVAIVCAIALFAAWLVGMASLPGTGPGKPMALAPVKAFAPPPGFVGSHVYGLWTLSCGKATPASGPGMDNPRCRTQGLINARRPDRTVVSLVAIRIVRAGPQKAPYLVLFLPVRSKGDGTMLFAVDTANAFRAPIKACSATTCKVEAPLPAGAMQQMLAGKTLKLQFGGSGPTKTAQLIYPLHGFRESYQALAAAE